MRTPESVYLDEGSGYLFVAQIDGVPDQKDKKGRISKLGLDGTVVTADWFTALKAPKGLRSFGGTLWVADIDEVVGIDIATAKVTARMNIDGAKFLNDVATGADGTVYVSDMMDEQDHTRSRTARRRSSPRASSSNIRTACLSKANG